MSKDSISYKDAGVDIEAGNSLVETIKPDIKSTNRPGVMAGIGGFGGFFDIAKCGYTDPVLVAATDGVGTKLKIAIEANDFSTIGQDLVAMCVNDLVVQGAEPLFFLDYYACSKLNEKDAAAVIKSIAAGCKLSGCALIGGETAEMPGMYKPGDFDLAGFSVGAVERGKVLPYKDDIAKGDVLIGIPSSGMHSNGFSLVRKIMEVKKLSYDDKADFDPSKTYAEIFLTPTELYVNSCLDLYKKNLVKAFSHITGGGFIENIPRILPEGLSFEIDYDNYQLPPLFAWLKEQANLDNQELFRAFNCGVGMVIVASSENEASVIEVLKEHNYDAKLLGNIV